MSIAKKSACILSAVGLSLAASLAAALPASANSDYSSKEYYTGSVYQWSYAEISDRKDSRGCGKWNSWTKLVNTTKKVKSVQTIARFKAWGFGLMTVGVSGGTSGGSGSAGTTVSSDTITRQWTNTNGAKGAYITGTVCVDWAIIYVGFQSEGNGFYNGTPRNTQTRWL
jgi:hypothetical protein